jgi:hypothetical protein
MPTVSSIPNTPAVQQFRARLESQGYTGAQIDAILLKHQQKLQVWDPPTAPLCPLTRPCIASQSDPVSPRDSIPAPGPWTTDHVVASLAQRPHGQASKPAADDPNP